MIGLGGGLILRGYQRAWVKRLSARHLWVRESVISAHVATQRQELAFVPINWLAIRKKSRERVISAKVKHKTQHVHSKWKTCILNQKVVQDIIPL